MMQIVTFLLAALIAPAAWAADRDADEPTEVTQQPVCFEIRNTMDYTVYGSFVTAAYTAPEGVTARHHSNFRLAPRHYAQFCSTGPFYPGRKLDLQLRTLIPVFECRTAIGAPIVIRGEKREDGGTRIVADCL